MQRLHLRCEAGGVQGVLVARHMSARCHMRVWGRYSAPLSRLCAARVRGGAGAACGDGVWHRHYTMYPDLVRHHNSEQKRARKAQRIRHPTTARSTQDVYRSDACIYMQMGGWAAAPVLLLRVRSGRGAVGARCVRRTVDPVRDRLPSGCWPPRTASPRLHSPVISVGRAVISVGRELPLSHPCYLGRLRDVLVGDAWRESEHNQWTFLDRVAVLR